MTNVDPLSLPCSACARPRGEHGGKEKRGKCPTVTAWGEGSTMYRNPSELPGRGPWLILEHCLAETHNTTRAGQSQAGRIKCICPRAVALKKERDRRWGETRNVMRREQRRAQKHANQVKKEIERIAAPRKGTGGGEKLTLTDAACRGQYDTVDAAFSSDRAYGPARDLCALCPVLASCRRYITEHELPAGSWGGVWAGMSPRERAEYRKEDARV